MARNKMIKTLILIGLAAIAFTGCSDNDNLATPSAVVDNAPPAVPANVTADLSGGSVTVAWAANTVDTDLAGYLVERENYGQITLLTSAPIMDVSYEDPHPAVGANIYRVFAVDFVGNESAVATSLVIITKTHPIADPIAK